MTKTDCAFCSKPGHKMEDCGELTVSEKRERLKRQGRCFVCLAKGHIVKFCRSKINCSACGRRHHRTVCEQGDTNNLDASSAEVVVSALAKGKSIQNQKGTVLLQTVVANATGTGKRGTVRCLLDGGSQRTFIQEKVSRSLDLPVEGEERLQIHAFGSETPRTVTMRRVTLRLRNLWVPEKEVVISALETPTVCGAVVELPRQEIKEELVKRGLQLADMPENSSKLDSSFSVLIGGDFYWQIVTGNIERLGGALVALETVFGWSVQGPTTTNSMSPIQCGTVAVLNLATVEQRADEQLKSFWDLESLGITSESQTQKTSDKDTLEQFETQIEFNDNRYEVHLPWKENGEILADNLGVAEGRFRKLIQRFRTDVSYYESYRKEIEDQLSSGVIEPVPEGLEIAQGTYYLPHHAVVRKDKTTTKFRIVFDASSHETGCLSLNDCLNTGPNLNPDLLTVLLKFRQHPIAFVADIEKAFLQISLAAEDRDATRFLWLEEPLQRNQEPIVKHFRMTRVLFGVSASPFLLAGTIRHHLKAYEVSFPDTCKLIDDYLYIDDLISGASDVASAIQMTQEAKMIIGTANMHLRKWKTNCRELRELWEEREFQIESVAEPASEMNQPFKVLGLIWDTERDELRFELKSLLDFLIHRKNTKRSVLKASARIFDPIGLLSPFVIRIKILFQELWERGLKWDAELPTDVSLRWNVWCAEISKLEGIAVPRPYTFKEHGSNCTIQLHVFSDASQRAYGAAVYCRFANIHEQTEVSLVTAKSRVAPLKRLTIPRLELMGALLGARLMNHVERVFENYEPRSFYWTDSTIALHWIKGSVQKWKPFVANRVIEIQSLSAPEAWSHCKGEENPADLLTRGQTAQELKDDNLWWSGPPWLMESEEQWPTSDIDVHKEEDSRGEERIRPKVASALPCVTTPANEILDLSNYSSIARVHRVTAWIKRFINNTRDPLNKRKGPLTADELREAEDTWIKSTQKEAFPQELENLRSNRQLNKESPINSLRPWLDSNGLMRVSGRLQQSSLSYSEKHPWILPANHRYSELQVLSGHERVFHAGLCDTLAQVRARFWIVRGRQLAKKLLSKCYVCRRFTAPAAYEIPAPLPRDRITQSLPFETTGIDFAGPLSVKVKNSSQKAYIALFTCAVTRAIHLELVSDLTTEKFLLALRRFLARRGLVKTIYSDNAKTFKRANLDLAHLWKTLTDPTLLNFYGKEGIKWKFIVPRAPWWGGFWERMVRSVKTCLRKVLGKSALTFEELGTLLTEVEAVINSRPITFTYNEVQEPCPLTPAHFLVGERLTNLPPSLAKEAPVATTATRLELNKRLRYRQTLLEGFWKRWGHEYLTDLKSTKNQTSAKTKPEIKQGDVVLVGEDKIKRQMWKMGRVLEVYRGRDDRVRSCLLKLSSGGTLRRPIQLLYPLEIGDVDEPDQPTHRAGGCSNLQP